MKNKFIIWLCLCLCLVAFTPKRIDYRRGMNNNVCKTLKGDVLLYYVFVDTKTTSPWTQFDIQSTHDSIQVAITWLLQQAKKNKISLNIISDYYVGAEFIPIAKDLPAKTVINSIETPNTHEGVTSLNKWADFISKKIGETYNIVEKEGIPEVKNPKNKERLIAYLRDKYKVESVALLFLVNNYYRNDISIQLNTYTNDDVEFAIVSYKYPAEIAHNFLHLFGAADLYETPYRKVEKNIKLAQQEFPNDIMLDPYAKNIVNIEIGNFTKYLIGWSDKLNEKYELLLIDKRDILK